jgi:uncharacterized protein
VATDSLLWDGPPGARDLVVLAPGAGAGMRHEFMQRVAAGLAKADIRVCRFDFPYARAGRRRPDPQPVLEAAYKEVVEGLASERAGKRLFVGGKSLGGRIASHVVSAGLDAEGLIFLGYPLHPPGKPERIRSAHLSDIRVPMLFVEGSRDPFCPLQTLEKVRAELDAPTDVIVVENGDHSFRVRKSSGRTNEEAIEEVISGVARWVAAL